MVWLQMQKRLLLFFSILMLFASTVLVFKDSTKLHRLVSIGTKLAVPYKTNQSENCTPPNYIFPREALISDELLPEKIRDSFGNTINITACFILDNESQVLFSEPMEFDGTAYMFEPGLFISARHIFLIAIAELDKTGRHFIIDKNGLPRGDRYHYIFYGTANINGLAVTFPLELIAMGDPYSPRDFAVFKAINLPSQLAYLEFGEPANLNDVVYSSGRVPSFNPLNISLNPVIKNVLSDFINFNFKGRISGIITNLPNNISAGFTKIYSIRTELEPGFSGGPVFNTKGKVIGLTISVSPGLSFSHAISAEDQILFIKELRDKGIIPKK